MVHCVEIRSVERGIWPKA